MIPIHFRPLRKEDLPLLFEWLGRAHVAQWWRVPRDYEAFAKKYSNYIVSDVVGPYFMYHAEKPIGYIAWYDAAHCPMRKGEYGGRVYGMDLFIADPEYLGKGYGADIIRQFIRDVLLPLSPSRLIIDPEISNERAIRVYEKVGFKKVRVGQATDGNKRVTAQIMELDPEMV